MSSGGEAAPKVAAAPPPLELPATALPCSTPRCVLKLPVARRNAQKILDVAQQYGVQLRPHVKTHKTVEGALIQTGGRRSGIVVSTLAEVRFFLERGFRDLVYGVPLVGEDKVRYIADILFAHGTSANADSVAPRDIQVVFDHPEQLAAVERVMAAWRAEHVEKGGVAAETKLHVHLMLGCGALPRRDTDAGGREKKQKLHQVGLDPLSDSALEFARKVQASAWCKLVGVYVHAAHSYSCTNQDECRLTAALERDCAVGFHQRLVKHGVVSESDRSFVVGVGSTPTVSHPPSKEEGGLTGVTEVHAGNYLCYDTMQLGIGSCQNVNEDIALIVKARVISHNEAGNRVIVDVGWTGLSMQGADQGYGAVLNFPELKIRSLKQETGEVGPNMDGGSKGEPPLDFDLYPLGTIVEIASFHACAVAHQYQKIFVEDEGGRVVGEWHRCPTK